MRCRLLRKISHIQNKKSSFSTCSFSQTKMDSSSDSNNKDSNFAKVTEGRANVYFNKTKNDVFYNPIQEFNRDLSISIMNTYSLRNDNKKLKILEALAASGIRSMRYALEIPNCREILANDLDKSAVELIKKNIELNRVEHLVKANCDDAVIYMNSMSRNKNDHFDCIDLDPYGSPAVFLDSAVRSIRSGGLLMVTATDAAVLCGNGVDACYTKYGSVSLRTPCCHEIGLRILLQSINSHAIRYSKYIVPLISLSIDFYFRVFVLVFDGQMKAKESLGRIGCVYVCSECSSFYPLNYGKSVPTSGNVKFVPHTNNANNFNLNKCSVCDGCLKMAGPLWMGNLHEKEFIKSVIDYVTPKSHLDFTTRDRMIGMLNLAYEELDAPFYYVLDQLSSVMHCETPNHKVMRSAILNANYSVSYSHCNKNSIKTNAPFNFIWALLKKWIELKPVNAKWFGSEYKLANIIKNVPYMDNVDFTIRADCFPNSKIEKLVRYHEPPPCWGPKSRPKRKSSEENHSGKKKEQQLTDQNQIS